MTAEELIKQSEKQLAENFGRADEISEYNQEKVLKAFNKNGIALRHFNATTGYGYGDDGRFALGDVFADSLGAEAGIVSPALLSGTHALTVGYALRHHSRRDIRGRKRFVERFRNILRLYAADGRGKIR